VTQNYKRPGHRCNIYARTRYVALVQCNRYGLTNSLQAGIIGRVLSLPYLPCFYSQLTAFCFHYLQALMKMVIEINKTSPLKGIK